MNINENIILHYIPMEKLKTTSFFAYIHRPLSEEEAPLNALLESMMRRGCKRFPNAASIESSLEELYGAKLASNVNKLGEDHALIFRLDTISEKYAMGSPIEDDAVSMFASVLFESALNEEAFEQEKKNLIEKIRNVINNKIEYARQRCCQEMCKGLPYAAPRLGTEEGVERITLDELKKHYRRVITESVIDIYICGECDIEKAANALRNAVSGMEFKPASRPTTELFKGSSEVKRITETMDVTQGKLAMGFTTSTKPSDKDYPALLVANSIYGSGVHSKLFNNVREKLSLAYYAASMIHKYNGIIIVNAGIEFENFQKAYDEILLQLDEVQNGNISDWEFNSSVSFLINSIKESADSYTGMTAFSVEQLLAGTDKTADEVIEELQSVTKAQAAEAARKIKLDTVYFLTGKEE